MTTTESDAPERVDVIAKLRNDGKAHRVVTDVSGNEIGLAPGETKSLRIPATQAEWIGANVPDLTVISTRAPAY